MDAIFHVKYIFKSNLNNYSQNRLIPNQSEVDLQEIGRKEVVSNKICYLQQKIEMVAQGVKQKQYEVSKQSGMLLLVKKNVFI